MSSEPKEALMFSLQRMGAHGRLARLCAVGGVAATSFALVKVPGYQQQQQKSRKLWVWSTQQCKLKQCSTFSAIIFGFRNICGVSGFSSKKKLDIFDIREWKGDKSDGGC